MKTIGRTNEGNVLVEMTRSEHEEFVNLENSISGGRFYFDGGYLRGVDISPVFKALNDLATTKHSIATLQDYINNLASYFGKVNIPKETDA